MPGKPFSELPFNRICHSSGRPPHRARASMIKAIFQRSTRYEGVRPINIYLLRLVYVLMFFVLGKTAWTHVLTHRGAWDPHDAIAWCVWTAFATLGGLGIFRPLKML